MWGVIIILALLIPLIAVVLDSAPARALAARFERELRTSADASDERIAALEAEVERLSGEVERLSEESSFLHRLLEGRHAEPGQLPGDTGGAALPPGERRE